MANRARTPIPPPPGPLAALSQIRRLLAAIKAELVGVEASPSYLMTTDPSLGPVTLAELGGDRPADVWGTVHAVDGALADLDQALGIVPGAPPGQHQAPMVSAALDRPRPELAEPGGSARTIADAVSDVRNWLDRVQTVVADVDRRWQRELPRLEAARTTIGRLERDVADLGVPEPLIGRARAQADALTAALTADPLAIDDDAGTTLEAAVEAAALQVASMRQSRNNLDADMAGTEARLAALRSLRAQAEAAAIEAETKLVPGSRPDLVQVPSDAIFDAPGGLVEQLDELFDGSTGAWHHQRGRLDRWLDAAADMDRQLRRALELNRSGLEHRDELRGRLKAYQAKVAAVGRAEDAELTDVVARARRALYTAPSDLSDAAAAIDDLARSLRS
ncbi:MAG: hypothetical protein AAF467_15990 [Actinomycetota bacterium]